MIFSNHKKGLITILGLMLILMVSGCTATGKNSSPQQAASPIDPVQKQTVDWRQAPPPPETKNLIAVAGFENKSTYSADRLWDTSAQLLSAHLLRTKYFRVVEWEKMKRLFDWDTLSHADIIKTPENLQEAQRVLLCDHFITGTITRFNVSTHAKSSALSKEKMIDTSVRVDLLLQNAMTGEYIAAGRGEHTIRQTYSPGQVGSWDSSVGDDALDIAIEKALFELIATYRRVQ